MSYILGKQEAGSCFALLPHRNTYTISNILLVSGITTLVCDRRIQDHRPSPGQQLSYFCTAPVLIFQEENLGVN